MHRSVRTAAILALVAGATTAVTSTADSIAEFRAAGSAAMQGDMSSALPYLRRLRLEDLPEERRAIATCMRERFIGRKAVAAPANLDPWTATVLALYRRYW